MTEKTTSKPKAFTPVTYWLANPGLQLRIRNGRGYITFKSGRYTARTEAEAQRIEQTGIAFREDMPEAPEPHPATGYAPRSFRAYQEHQKLIPFDA